MPDARDDSSRGRWDREHDVVLVGGGVGSLCAAIVLADCGLRPLIVEKTNLIGGASAYSGGIVWAPNNHRMRAKNLADSRDDALAYLDRISCGRGDHAIAQSYVDAVPRIAEDLQRRTCLRWVTYPNLPDYYAELPGGKMAGRFLLPHQDLVGSALDAATTRWPQMAYVRPSVHLRERQKEWVWGRALVGCLWASVLEAEIPFLLEHWAISLIKWGDKIEGVVLSGPNGNVNVRGRLGVLLDTGGFEWNDELTLRHVPGARLHPQTPPANEGDGHVMAAEVGAAFALMDQTIGMSSVRVPGEMNVDRSLFRIFFQELALPHSLLVNAKGRRFANETYFVDVASAWNQVAPDGTSANLPCFFVFDESYRLKYGLPAGLSPQVSLSQHESLEGLARTLRIDSVGLVSEVQQYNDMIKIHGRDEFGRGATAYQRVFGDMDSPGNPTLGPVEKPPFYGVEIHPATSGHRGGVVIDAHARVLDLHGDVIPGLFACGCCAAGTLTGGTYFSGAAVGHAMVFGTLAAERIVSDASSNALSIE
jgi:succinate dehydrogenase/fumarate reductase flavoprotein subunit